MPGPHLVPEALRLDVGTPANPRVLPDAKTLYAEYADRVFRWALRFGAGNTAWAEDIVQDVFVGLLTRMPEVRDAHDLGGWFYRITANRCLSHLRRERLRAALSLRWITDSAPIASRPPDAIAGARTELVQAASAIAALPPKQRVVFCMHHLDGLDQHEVADMLGYSRGYVSKLLKHAAQLMRDHGWRIDHG